MVNSTINPHKVLKPVKNKKNFWEVKKNNVENPVFYLNQFKKKNEFFLYFTETNSNTMLQQQLAVDIYSVNILSLFIRRSKTFKICCYFCAAYNFFKLSSFWSLF